MHSVCFLEAGIHLRLEGDAFSAFSFPQGIFHGWGTFPGDEFVSENYTQGCVIILFSFPSKFYAWSC